MKRRIAILTSSRADYGIYRPLLERLATESSIAARLVVFGMHLLPKFGQTVQVIRQDGVMDFDEVPGMSDGDSSSEVIDSYGELVKQFGQYWSQNNFDLIFALGDRFEMSAAVQAAIVFEIPIAHIHGGEITLGAIDNIYRNQISVASQFHFVTTEESARRVAELKGTDSGVYNVGSLSVSQIDSKKCLPWDLVRGRFDLPCEPFILATFHPETVGLEKNHEYSLVVYKTLLELSAQVNIVLTGTNADPAGNIYREIARKLKEELPDKIFIVESFGRENYFSALTACELVLGNSSSGIIEAASFNKYVVNIGDRQKGRTQSENIVNVPFEKDQILKSVEEVTSRPEYAEGNVYYKANTADVILEKVMEIT